MLTRSALSALRRRTLAGASGASIGKPASRAHSSSISRLCLRNLPPNRTLKAVFDPSRPLQIISTVPLPQLQASRSFSSTPAFCITDPKTGRGETRGPKGPGSGATKEDAASQTGEYNINQPEFESTTSSQPGKDPEVEKAAGFHDLPEENAEQPRRPLPDLRHGIPPTFGEEFGKQDYQPSDQKGSSFKEQDAPEPSVNVTEDPTKDEPPPDDDRGLPKQAYVSSIERRRNRMANIAYLAALIAAVGGFVYMGQEWETEEEQRRYPDAPNGWSPGAMYARASTRVSSQLGYYTEPVSTNILPEVSLEQRPPYTLVLSLEDLLITSKWTRENGWQVAKRPGFDYFIRYLTSYFELVVYTSVPSMNGQMVMQKLDPYHLIMWHLFREHTRYVNGEHVKDLSCLNRDLSKTIIIDTKAEHVKYHPENAIVLPKWNGKPKDEHAGDLVALIPFLEYIATQPNMDVRKALKSFEGQDIPKEFARREAQLRAEVEARSQRSSKRAGGLTSALGFGGQQNAITMQDRLREQGRLQYEALEKQIREEGAKWLEMEEQAQKQQMEEITKTVKSNPLAYFSIMFGGAPPGEQKPDKDDPK